MAEQHEQIPTNYWLFIIQANGTLQVDGYHPLDIDAKIKQLKSVRDELNKILKGARKEKQELEASIGD